MAEPVEFRPITAREDGRVFREAYHREMDKWLGCDPTPLCPVCGRPAEQRAWCSQECEDFEATGKRPK